MDFVKKNWVKLVAIAFLVTIATLAMIALINAFIGSGATELAKHQESQLKAGAFTYLGVLISVTAMIAFIVIKMLGKDKKIASIVLIAGAVVATIMIIVAISVGSDFLKNLSDTITLREAQNKLGLVSNEMVNAAKTAYYTQIAQTITFMIVFGLAPIVFGIRKLCKKCEG